MRNALLSAALLYAGSAHAQERVCEGFAVDDYRGLVKMARSSVVSGEFPKAYRILSDTRSEMRCLDAMLHERDIVNLAELYAIVSLMDQDEEHARRWVQLRITLAGREPWQVRAPQSFETFIANVPDPKTKRLDGILIHPKKQTVTMNGAILTELLAPVEVPVFVQMVYKNGETETSYWQDGVRFRDEMTSGPGKSKMPGWASNLSPPVPPEATVVGPCS